MKSPIRYFTLSLEYRLPIGMAWNLELKGISMTNLITEKLKQETGLKFLKKV